MQQVIGKADRCPAFENRLSFAVDRNRLTQAALFVSDALSRPPDSARFRKNLGSHRLAN
jgi:hypothetical protein